MSIAGTRVHAIDSFHCGNRCDTSVLDATVAIRRQDRLTFTYIHMHDKI